METFFYCTITIVGVCIFFINYWLVLLKAMYDVYDKKKEVLLDLIPMHCLVTTIRMWWRELE